MTNGVILIFIALGIRKLAIDKLSHGDCDEIKNRLRNTLVRLQSKSIGTDVIFTAVFDWVDHIDLLK